MRRAKKKVIDVERMKPLTPKRAFSALIGDEEKIGKQKKERKERSRIEGSYGVAFLYS